MELSYLTISYAINDCSRVERSVFKEKLTALVEEAKSVGVNPILIQEQHTTALATSATYADYRAAVAEVGAATGVPVLDLHSATVDMPSWCRAKDTIHITSAGAEYVADAVAMLLQDADTDLKYYIK